jgi:outer membrane protein OmpA-like peptidoglycan-associated protein
MKKTILLAGWLLAACPAAFAQTHYLENLKLENQQVSKTGSHVTVSADIVLDEMELNRQQSLRLVPVLVSADGMRQQELAPVLIEGKVRSKVTDRRLALGEMVEEEGTVRIKHQKGEEQTVAYQAEVPFAPWMVNGSLELRGYITGCAECNEGDEVITAGNVLPYSEPVFAMAPAMKPTEEQVKRRAEDKSARLEYRRDSYAVLPEYRTNRAELDSVQHSLALVKDNPNLTITGIYITGYASPEGSMTYNERLSQRRAQTFADYVRQHNRELEKELWHVAWKGEDWDGFRRQVEQASGWEKRQDVLQMLEGCEGSQDDCEKQIRASLSREDYQYLLDELYAPLRRNDYRIEYTVRNFTPEEARQMLETRPDLLSAAEMQRVADGYGHGSENYRKALRIALRTYPDNVAIRHNLALAEVEAGNYTEAITLLKEMEDGASLNLLGVAYFKSGNRQQAVQAFGQAVQAGYAQAEGNTTKAKEALDLWGK